MKSCTGREAGLIIQDAASSRMNPAYTPSTPKAWGEPSRRERMGMGMAVPSGLFMIVSYRNTWLR